MSRTNRRKKIPCCDAETIKQGAFFALLFMGVKYIYNDTNIINKKALKTKVKRYVREKTWSMFSSISVFLFICFVAYKTTCSVLSDPLSLGVSICDLYYKKVDDVN